ncbi:MAG: hypothetical protein K8T20_19685 [Planctomycetes bacterium]|nr:hypothetical protein [Planctomycetota bacterium]
MPLFATTGGIAIWYGLQQADEVRNWGSLGFGGMLELLVFGLLVEGLVRRNQPAPPEESGGFTFNVHLLSCAECGRCVKLRELQPCSGRCPNCRGRSWNVSLTASTYTPPSAVAVGAGVASALLIGHGIVPRGERTELAVRVPRVEGEFLVKVLTGPNQGIEDWLETVRAEELKRKEAKARANPAPNQGVCVVCNALFIRGASGPTSLGYCSRICERKA